MTAILLSGVALQPASAQPAAFTLNAKSKAVIVVPNGATPPELTAAKDLDNYLTKITGGDFSITKESARRGSGGIYVGATAFAARAGVDAKTLKSEAWRIKTQGKSLILAGGGTRGTLYAAYRFLEDYAGVHWWNPWEETVPSLKALTVPPLDRSGAPAFAYRDIYTLYGRDDGRFAIRNRLNRDGDAPISGAYGGSRDYGPPYHVHTFYKILSPDKYYAAHPDWFIVPGGGFPTADNSQLAMSNPGLRQEFLKLLRQLVRDSHREARLKGLPVPDVFSVSQMDNPVTFATPADAELVAKNGGADSAVLIEFVNFLADNLKAEFPGLFIDTLAYFAGEKAPKTVRPRDNVIVRLTDTTSNLILPVTDARNADFRKKVEDWAKVTKNLRIWDYAVTFNYPGLPMPTTNTYQPDLRFLRAHNVEGIFVEHEYPIIADMRDFKVWVQCKLFEDPEHDYDALVKQFTDGFYGPAGFAVRRYISALKNEAVRVGKEKGFEEITWTVAAKPYNYLSIGFVVRANAMFDEAESKVTGNKIWLRRVRHARLPLDRFIAVMYHKLGAQWVNTGKPLAMLPLDLEKTTTRYATTWNEQAELRLPEAERKAERTAVAQEIARLTKPVPAIPLKFRDLAPSTLLVYDTTTARNFGDRAKLVPDPQAETGSATRLEISDDEVQRYKPPMTWGIYNLVEKKDLISNNILDAAIPSPGYHWHRLGETTLTGNDYIYFFWSWLIQLDIADAFEIDKPNQRFEIWANVKFEGSGFPHGQAGQKNAISVERVVLVKK